MIRAAAQTRFKLFGWADPEWEVAITEAGRLEEALLRIAMHDRPGLI